MMKRLRTPVLLGIPPVLGLVGFLLDGVSPLNALFTSICMYALNYQDPPPNLWVEFGRWLAPLATASGVFMAVSALRKRVRADLRYRRGNSVAVYGPEAEQSALLAQLGNRGIRGGDKFLPAQRYILPGEDGFDFYLRYQDKLADREVYIRCDGLPAQSVSPPGLHLFRTEETAARLFWKRYPLYQRSVQRGHHLNIVFLGFGKLGEELLSCGLQDNLFSPDQHIAYHIFGGDGAFQAVHTQLGEISDPVLFHSELWYDQLPLLEEADLVLVLQQEDQLSLLRELLLATCRPRFHVFTAGASGLTLLDGQERLKLFAWRQEAQSPELIFSDTLYRRAKAINLRYAHLYGGVPEDEENRETQWQALDAFTRYSNISAADYHEIRLDMLRAMEAAPRPRRCWSCWRSWSICAGAGTTT